MVFEQIHYHAVLKHDARRLWRREFHGREIHLSWIERDVCSKGHHRCQQSNDEHPCELRPCCEKCVPRHHRTPLSDVTVATCFDVVLFTSVATVRLDLVKYW